jgi:hypothetical protein
MPHDSVIILPLLDDMDKIEVFRHDVVKITCEASEKTHGPTCFCPHEFTCLLRSITQKVKALSPCLEVNWFVSYVQFGQRGRSQLLTTYKNHKVRCTHVILFFYVNIVFSNDVSVSAILINRRSSRAWFGSWIMPTCTMLKTTTCGMLSS